MTKARLGIVCVVAHPAARMFAQSYLQKFSLVVRVVCGICVAYVLDLPTIDYYYYKYNYSIKYS